MINYISKRQHDYMEYKALFGLAIFLCAVGYAAYAINCDCIPAPAPPNITWTNCTSLGGGATNVFVGGDDYCVAPDQPPCDPTLCPVINYTTGCIWQNTTIPEGAGYSICKNPKEIQFYNCVNVTFKVGNVYSCDAGQVCRQYQLPAVDAGCIADTTTTIQVYNISWESSTPISQINQTQWIINGWGWVLPFFTPLFMVTSVTGLISGVAGKFGGVAIAGIIALMLTLVFTIIGIYPAWLGIAIIVIGGFIIVNMMQRSASK